MSSVWANLGGLLKENRLRTKRASTDTTSTTGANKSVKREPLEDISNHQKRTGLIKVEKSIKIGGTTKSKTTKDDKNTVPSVPVTKTQSSIPIPIPAQTSMTTSERLSHDDFVSEPILELKADEKLLRSPREMEEDLMDVEEGEQGLPFEVANIDEDLDDPQMCAEYIKEIHQNLRNAEKRYMPINYLPHQTDINSQMRGILIDWLVEVAEEYKLSPETLFLGINYLDRYLSSMVIPRAKLQLLGIACMFVASKFEEVHPPVVNEFVYISDYTYTKEEIFDLEASILNVLQFNLSAPSTKHFLRRYLKAAGGDPNVSVLANYLAQLSLMEYVFVQYLPSQIALCSVVLALHTLGHPAWTPTLAHYSGYSWDSPNLKKCLEDLHKYYVAVCLPDHPQKSIKEKYSQSKFGRIANHSPPIALPRL
eukprot:TRINITY_DN14994_c0_g1_i1.p1 TRINITY_DN14994_c0_g1~~TRINITY_DN14994_c0_g1_i1.p1  ORF type:complete len:423 (+),score=60.26 TRINITY_DN14994_c0_g1_i1:173-1441(+)